jgi:hypothetical protein
MLAEAASRDWINASAEELYNEGVRLHMEQMALFDVESTVPEADIVTYLNENPY